ncbi:2Fe-2S iron-sulfur cluster-binding protein [Pseudomonas sp. NBRC 100443]|uniref:2Fe-2S iron-sulfur cluster-binding protein n=1 Tax=Pseudomonas sp. NBRC 100443 TaxID=1113665 RepID=UPI0024A3B8B2|nr:2Fe-2S iron-sulfur cluster-binding protein [Pseudomonas sp. NBRC 100443]GLU37338.1 (2Fe-2S) ferredoxin [Pseudomonas sp. NBRC 100443]
MPTITYIEHDGTPHQVEVASGDSLMQGAVNHAVPGIDADCGGACACATCHVYVEESWLERLAAPDAMERAMLECAQEVRGNSRLACQIAIRDELDGLQVRMPKFQGM